MKIRTKYFLCVTLALILIALPSCSMFWSSNLTYSGGQMLDDELMSSMRAEIIGDNTETSKPSETIKDVTIGTIKDEADETAKEETESSRSDTEAESDTSKDEDSTRQDNTETSNTVYWTKGGGVYHLYEDCSYIKSSSEILSGSAEEAIEAGKSGVCSRCQNRKDKE